MTELVLIPIIGSAVVAFGIAILAWRALPKRPRNKQIPLDFQPPRQTRPEPAPENVLVGANR